MKERRHNGDHMKDDTRIALLEQSTGHINETLMRIEKRLDQVDNKIEAGFNRIGTLTDTNFKWLLSLMIGGFIGTLGLVAHALKWL